MRADTRIPGCLEMEEEKMRRSKILILALLGLTCPLPLLAGSSLEAPAKGRLKVAFVMTEGATMIDFAGPWEVFQDVHVPERGSKMEEQMPFELFTIGQAKTPIQTSGGMAVVPDFSFADAPRADIIVVGAQRGAPGLDEFLQKAHARNTVVMSVCTGAFKLAKAGLLEGKPATTHHMFYDAFAEQYPKVELERSKRYVQSDSHTFTAGGLTSGIDLALHIVALYFGDETAERTAQYMEYQSSGWRSEDVTTASTKAK